MLHKSRTITDSCPFRQQVPEEQRQEFCKGNIGDKCTKGVMNCAIEAIMLQNAKETK